MTPADVLVILPYVALTVLGLAVIWKFLPVRTRLTNGTKHLVDAVLVLNATLVGENVYYGAARMTDNYDALTWFWPMVFLFKAGFAVGGVMMLWAFSAIQGDD